MEAVIHRAIENQMIALQKNNKVVLLFGTRRALKLIIHLID
jgi:hypothetical protein